MKKKIRKHVDRACDSKKRRIEGMCRFQKCSLQLEMTRIIAMMEIVDGKKRKYMERCFLKAGSLFFFFLSSRSTWDRAGIYIDSSLV